jgi:hypothetical protein
MVVMKSDDDSVRCDMGVGLDVVESQFDGIRERLKRILGPVSGSSAMCEGDRSIVF